MRVLLITGSYPPEVCGIGDYARGLAAALADAGVRVGVLTARSAAPSTEPRVSVLRVAVRWALSETPALLHAVRRFEPDIVHVQYPGTGYGYSLVPHLLTILLSFRSAPLVFTAHEFGIAHPLRRTSVVPPILVADEVVFTTTEEKRYVEKALGRLRRRLRRAPVIPIGSSLPDLPEPGGYDRNLMSFWGMFHRGKGVGLLLRAFALARESVPELRLQLIGSVRRRDEAFIKEVKDVASGPGLGGSVTMCLDRPASTVRSLLQRSCAVVLPFGDGVTFRRSTFVAALRLGVPVLTTRGRDTPLQLVDRQNVFLADSPEGLAAGMLALRNDTGLRATVSAGALRLAAAFNWDNIAQQHAAVYRKLLLGSIPR